MTLFESCLDSFNPVAQMMNAKEISFLPSELWTQVFARLPVKDLLKFRCVCKEWCFIIDSPDFVSLHLTNFSNNCDGFYLLSVGWNMYGGCEWMLQSTDTFRKVMDLPKLKFKPYCVKGYINGLLLIHHRDYYARDKIILFNPSVRKFMQLPPSPVLHLGRSDFEYVEVGLGWDFSSNDHKVVAIAYSSRAANNEAAVSAVSVEVFSLNTGCWKSVDCGTIDPSFERQGVRQDVQMFVKGVIYWIVVCPETGDYKILSFDVAGEMISYIDLPAIIEDDGGGGGGHWKDISLAILDGCLAMLDTFEEHCCIWELDKHGGNLSWTRRYTIDLQWPFDLLCPTKNHKLLFAIEDVGVISYDLKSGRTNKLANIYPEYGSFFDLYVESLVLFKEADGQIM